jgi:hypothetical protein
VNEGASIPARNGSPHDPDEHQTGSASTAESERLGLVEGRRFDA